MASPHVFNKKRSLPSITHVIAIASGKGGVGKSTVSANLAVTMAMQGYSVGLLDADIYGPSMGQMLGIHKKPAVSAEKKFIPHKAHGIKAMSMAFMMPQDKAAVWRGPMVQSAFLQMLFDTDWGALDVLFMDMPPGTGDIQLTMAQQVAVSGGIIVSTPQDIALIDARKAVNMFQAVQVPVLGVVENMSTFACPHCHTCTPIFGEGGAQSYAEKEHIPFLGAIPLMMALRQAADDGAPAVLFDAAAAEAYAQLGVQHILKA